MQNTNFLKEVIANTKNNVSLVELNQSQVLGAIDFILKHLLQENKIILISFLKSGEKILEKFKSENLFVIDCFSEENSEEEKIIKLSNPNDLVRIQIAVEKFEEKINEETIIILDSISLLTIYNSSQIIGKFIYYFSNKIKLENNSGIFFVSTETDEETLELIRQFFDNDYDFSDLYVEKIEAKA
jgi:KaiC/GvpD/RAD55 family RecA-like ATPase